MARESKLIKKPCKKHRWHALATSTSTGTVVMQRWFAPFSQMRSEPCTWAPTTLSITSDDDHSKTRWMTIKSVFLSFTRSSAFSHLNEATVCICSSLATLSQLFFVVIFFSFVWGWGQNFFFFFFFFFFFECLLTAQLSVTKQDCCKPGQGMKRIL